jgi:hypothetical protein
MVLPGWLAGWAMNWRSIQAKRLVVQRFIQSTSCCQVWPMYQLGQTYWPRMRHLE